MFDKKGETVMSVLETILIAWSILVLCVLFGFVLAGAFIVIYDSYLDMKKFVEEKE